MSKRMRVLHSLGSVLLLLLVALVLPSYAQSFAPLQGPGLQPIPGTTSGYFLTTGGSGTNPSWSSVTLQKAYDDGGAGLGRTFTANSGAVRINKSSVDANGALEVVVTAGTGLSGLFSGASISCPGAGANSERFGLSALAAGASATAIGRSASASATDSVALGETAVASGTGVGKIAIGSDSLATGNGDSSIAIGDGAASTSSVGGSSTAVGAGAAALGDNSSAFGFLASTVGLRATAVGAGAFANQTDSTALGSGTVASGTGATSVGRASSVSTGGTNSTAVGFSSSIIGVGCSAFGASSSVTSTDSIAIGETAASSIGTGNIAIGSDAIASGATGAIAIGDDSIAAGAGSIVVGSASTTAFANTILLGRTVTSTTTNQMTVGSTTSPINDSRWIQTNNTTAFTIRLGGSTSSFAAIRRPASSSNVQLLLGDLSGPTGLQVAAATLTVSTTLATFQSRTLLLNDGATAEVVYTLPDAQAGLTFWAVVTDTDGIQITAATGDTIRIGSSVSAAGGNVMATVVGSTILLVCVNGTEWVAITTNLGPWMVT